MVLIVLTFFSLKKNSWNILFFVESREKFLFGPETNWSKPRFVSVTFFPMLPQTLLQAQKKITVHIKNKNSSKLFLIFHFSAAETCLIPKRFQWNAATNVSGQMNLRQRPVGERAFTPRLGKKLTLRRSANDWIAVLNFLPPVFDNVWRNQNCVFCFVWDTLT